MSKRRFGLIGHPLGHSLSPLLHSRIMQAVGIDGTYEPIDIAPQALPARLPALLRTLDGLNVTLPHKQAVIPFLTDVDEAARRLGAVNTVCAGKGYNTDALGFALCRVPMQNRRVLVLGAGGVARVLVPGALAAGAKSVDIYARDVQKAHLLARQVGDSRVTALSDAPQPGYEVVLNGTPVGMYPDNGSLPVAQAVIDGARAVYDTIYNPTATRMVLRAKSAGIRAQGGLRMLYEQALAAQKLWNPQVDFAAARPALDNILPGLAREVLRQSPVKLLLTGYMGSGKTRIAQRLSHTMGEDLPMADLDERIVLRAGCAIPRIFERHGEQYFRRLERDELMRLLQAPGPMVIATGGGTLVQPGAARAVHEAGGLIVLLEAKLDTVLSRICPGAGDRPMINGGEQAARTLFEQRAPLYREAADLIVDANGGVRSVVNQILRAFEWEAQG